MTHSPDFDAETRRRKSAPISRLCDVPMWYQIFLVPDSGADRLCVLFRADFWAGVVVAVAAARQAGLRQRSRLLTVVRLVSRYRACQVASLTCPDRQTGNLLVWPS